MITVSAPLWQGGCFKVEVANGLLFRILRDTRLLMSEFHFTLTLLNFLLFLWKWNIETNPARTPNVVPWVEPGQSIHAHYDVVLRYSIWSSSFLSQNMLLLQKELSPCSCGRFHLLSPSWEPFTTRIQRKHLHPASFPPQIKRILMHYLIWSRDWFCWDKQDR